MSNEAIRRYKAAHYAKTEFLLPKDVKPKLVEYSKSHGFDSFSGFIAYCLEKETGIPCRLQNDLPWIDSKKRKDDQKDS